MLVYLDESGDMGWKLNAPYRQGGSSRYLCIAFLFVPKTLHKEPQKIISGLYQKYKWKHEKKCADASSRQKLEFANLAVGLINSNPSIKLDCIIANKDKVQSHIRQDANKLYNYMSRLVVVDRVLHGPNFDFIPDKRSIKVESGNSLSDYLQTVIWLEENSITTLTNKPGDSCLDYNLQFVDWIAHCVWINYENGEADALNVLRAASKIRELYF